MKETNRHALAAMAFALLGGTFTLFMVGPIAAFIQCGRSHKAMKANPALGGYEMTEAAYTIAMVVWITQTVVLVLVGTVVVIAVATSG